MKIFLAGATGAIGRLLIPLLVHAGHEVAGTTRSPDRMNQIAALDARPLVMDALDRDAVFAALEAERPDVVMHQLTDLAGRDFAANSRLRIEGSRNLVDASLAVGVEHMIAQSIAWICIPGESPSREDEPLDLDAPPPRGDTVAATKALEDAVAEMPVGVVLRYGMLYGPGTWYSRDGSFIIDRIKSGEMAATDAVTSFLHVADAAQAAFHALAWPAGVYNIVDNHPAPGNEWIPLVASLIGAPSPPIKSGREGWERGSSNTRARQLGWSPLYPSWRDGFAKELA
ncbi:MAG: NAD(P)-dependent oxidoreductase [Anaerolineae bacterium]|nr:NAD(P)-dependent oxidoreductase [Anaerolineae bacterium]